MPTKIKKAQFIHNKSYYKVLKEKKSIIDYTIFLNKGSSVALRLIVTVLL